jgi:hypothetical protein
MGLSPRRVANMGIMTGLSAVTQALNVANWLRGIEKGYDAAEFKLKIAELNSALADAKLALADAKTEMESKQAEIEVLIAQFQVRIAAVEYNGYKYERGPDGKSVGYPYCPVCESNGKMTQTTYSGGNRFDVCCPRCKAVYRGVSHFPYPPQ